MKRIAALSAVVAGFVTLSVSAGLSQASYDTKQELIEGALLDYSNVLGIIKACEPAADGAGKVKEMSAKVALWRHPGWWAWIAGERAAYEAEIQDRADLAYVKAAMRGCQGLPGMYQTLADSWEGQLDQWTTE